MKKRKYSIPPAAPPPRPPAISVPRQARLPAAHTYDHWTAEEERLLGTRPDREVAQLLHRTVRAIESQRHRIGRSEVSVRMQRRKLGIPAFGQWHPPSARRKSRKNRHPKTPHAQIRRQS
jgi:hypothetical protein